MERGNDQTRFIIKKNYAAFKSEYLKPFAQPFHKGHRSIEIREDFRSKEMARLASHPHVKPTFSNFPTTNVIFDGASGSLKDRCHDMRLLTFKNKAHNFSGFSISAKNVN